VVGMTAQFDGRLKGEPSDDDILGESGKRANYFAFRNVLFRSMIFVNGMIGGIAPTDFAPDELSLANNQLSAFIPGVDHFMPDRTARNLELYLQKLLTSSNALIRRNNDHHKFQIPIEQTRMLNKDERKRFAKDEHSADTKSLMEDLESNLHVRVVGTAMHGATEEAAPTAGSNAAKTKSDMVATTARPSLKKGRTTLQPIPLASPE
jgi:hypothetical protein